MPIPRYGVDEEFLTLQHLTNVIEREIQRLKKASDDENFQEIDEDSYEAEVDLLDDEIENLIGLNFIAAQNFITAVEGNYIQLKQMGILKEAFCRKAIISLCGDKGLAEKVIWVDAVANYVKHHDEWNEDWENPTPLSKGTIKLVKHLGLKPYSRRNVQIAFSNIFKLDFDGNLLCNELKTWSDCVLDKILLVIKQSK